jgi:lipid-binding SYLF domain-containing protein
MSKPLSLAAASLVLLFVAACAQTKPARVEAEALVDRARWTLETFKHSTEQIDDKFRQHLADARGVVIFPAAFKGAFVFGAEGGSGVLLARDASGEWGYPAFYTMGSGSFGLQAGAQSSEIILVLRSDKAVRAVVYHQGKLGADLELTLANIGAGVEGSTTSNFGADVVGYAHSAGVYGGLSLEGAALVRRNDLNQAYYGQGATPQAIVFKRQFTNAHADVLRSALVM